MAAGIYHMIRRARSAAPDVQATKREEKLTPEENLRRLDAMTRALDEQGKARKK